MKHRYLLTVFLLLFCCIGVCAKKVKLDNGIVYKGDVLNDVPNGRGVLYLQTTIHYTSGNVYHTPFIIEGDFEGNIIRNATLSETRYPDYSTSYNYQRFTGTVVYDIKEENGEKIFVLQVSDNGTCLGFHKASDISGTKEWQLIKDYKGSINVNSVKSPKSAKTKKGKIKYSKSFIYVGETSDKTPLGSGALKMNSLIDKKVALLSIEGNFDNTIVNNAVISLNGGITINAERIVYRIITSSAKDQISLDVYNCTLNDGARSIHDIKNISFGCYRMQKEKVSHIDLKNTRVKGLLKSDFIQDDVVQNDMSLLHESANNIASEEVSIELGKEALGEFDDKMVVSDYNYSVLTVRFISGASIQSYDDYKLYKYPNGDFVKSANSNKPLEFFITLSDGTVKAEGNNTTLTYSDGRIFKSGDHKAASTGGKRIGDCKTVSDIKLLNGELQYSNKIVERYVNGTVEATTYPLSDGGFYTISANGHKELKYPNGDLFVESTTDGLLAPQDTVCDNTCEDYKLVNGKLTKANGDVLYYKNSIHLLRTYTDLKQIAFPIARETGDFGCTKKLNLQHRGYDGKLKESNAEQLLCLIKNDAAGYFELDNIKTELQKKTFCNDPEYASVYLPRMQQERKYLLEDQYMVKIPLKDFDSDLKDFKFNAKTNRFEFEIRDTYNKRMNMGCKYFHILFYDYLALTYPKSLISMTMTQNLFDQDLYVQNGQTCKVSDEDALKVENNIGRCSLVMLFKFEQARGPIDGIRYIYGKTTRLFIMDDLTGELYCDLSETLRASSAAFKSTSIDKTPKQTYHARGRMETCPLCLGSGDIKSWRDGSYNRCTTCGGKGWVIGHYW